MANTNCLEGMRCPDPECQSEGPFEIKTKAVFRVSDDGAEVDGDVSWDGDDRCSCVECGYSSTVNSFKIENQEEEG